MIRRYISLVALCVAVPALANHETLKVDVHHHEHHKHHTHSKEGLAAVGASFLQITEKHAYLTTLVPVAALTAWVYNGSPDLHNSAGQALTVGGFLVGWWTVKGLYRTIAQSIMQQCDVKPLRN